MGLNGCGYSTDSFPNSGIDMLVDDLNRKDERKTFEIWSKEFPDFVPEIKDLEKGCGILRVPR
jgi:hypothetical protein